MSDLNRVIFNYKGVFWLREDNLRKDLRSFFIFMFLDNKKWYL